jgi:hypothetical protein
MFFSAATEPGVVDSPNEDWVAVSPTVSVVLDGVTVFKGVETGCMHGTPWYVDQLGIRLLTAASDSAVSLQFALESAIASVADLHADTCDLSQIGAPSAAVAIVRRNHQSLDYLVLADVTILFDSASGLTVVSDGRVTSTVEDLAGMANAGFEVMKRRERYRNKKDGYWVAAADPSVAKHAKVGNIPLVEVRRAAMMSDGVTRLVDTFGQTDWPGILALAFQNGPESVIERVRKIEASDKDKKRWPRFKGSDDATIVLVGA